MIQLGFGDSNQMWSISPADFQLTEVGQGQCLGAFFELPGSGSAPPWIIGDTFLVCPHSPPRFAIGYTRLTPSLM